MGLTAAWDLESGNRKAEVGLLQSEAPWRPAGERSAALGRRALPPPGPLGVHSGPVTPHPPCWPCLAQPSGSAPSRWNMSSHCPEADHVVPVGPTTWLCLGLRGFLGGGAGRSALRPGQSQAQRGKWLDNQEGPLPLPRKHAEPEPGCCKLRGAGTHSRLPAATSSSRFLFHQAEKYDTWEDRPAQQWQVQQVV